MNSEKRVPKIRFPEFTNSWERHKLFELMDFSNGFNGGAEMYGRGVPYISVMDILNNDYITYDCIRGKVDLDGAALQRFSVEYGDVLFQRSSENSEDAGSSNVYISQEASVFGGFVIRGKKKASYSPFFMKHILNTAIVRKQIVSKAQGAQHINVSQEILSDVELYTPSLDEQTNIGDCFFKIDRLIDLQRREIEHLKKYKRGTLQKMFPRDGALMPEIRFSGFTDAWEQRKLGDQMYIKSRIGWQALTKKEYLDYGDYYLITGTDIDEDAHSVDLSRCFFVTKDRYEMDDKIQVREGDIIVTKDGTIGKVAMVTGLDKPATLNSHLFVLRDQSGKLDNRFLLQVLCSHIFEDFVESTKTGSTLTGLPQKTMIEFKFMVPKLEEQKCISRLLDNLDNLITLHQRKLEQAKLLKAGLLQQMFV